MVKTPLVSIVCPAARTQYWLDLYNSLMVTNLLLEFVFVGPNKPKFRLPENFRFIKSQVKPAQAAEIASRESQGEFIYHSADDLIYSPYFLDVLYKKWQKNNIGYLTVISGMYYYVNKLQNEKGRCFFSKKDKGGPLLTCDMFMKRTMWDKIGGIDKRFIAAWWPNDIQLRMYELEGEMRVCKKAILRERKIVTSLKKRMANLKGVSDIDRILYLSLWFEGNKLKIKKLKKKKEIYCMSGKCAWASKRLLPLQLFDDKDILTISQGPKGKWE